MKKTKMVPVLTRRKSGRTTLGKAFHMIDWVRAGLRPEERAVARQLTTALKALQPYRDDPAAAMLARLPR